MPHDKLAIEPREEAHIGLLRRQIAALDEAVDGQDVAVGRSDVLLVRAISANAVDERPDHGQVSGAKHRTKQVWCFASKKD